VHSNRHKDRARWPPRHLLDGGQRFARREHPGADRVTKRVDHPLPGRPAARS